MCQVVNNPYIRNGAARKKPRLLATNESLCPFTEVNFDIYGLL